MLPKKIEIGGVTYTISEVEVIEIGSSTAFLGMCNSAKARIELHKGMNYDMKVECLFHEMLHAIVNASGLSLGSREETIVQALSSHLHRALKPYLSFAKE